MAIVTSYALGPFDESDPDDYRPSSRWALLVDPGGQSEARVDDITLIVEVIAPGDRIPLHTHPINEVIAILEGTPEVTLGENTREVGPGAIVFIPADTPHGTRNAGTSPVRLTPCSHRRRSGSATSNAIRRRGQKVTRRSPLSRSTSAHSRAPDDVLGVTRVSQGSELVRDRGPCPALCAG